MSDARKKIHEGWEAMLRRDLVTAERTFAAAAEASPQEADAWNGLGAVHFERGEIAESLKCHVRALDAAKKSHGGKLPAKLAWDDAGKPALRALHGIGLNHFRSGEFDKAIADFEEELAKNPSDDQGAHFLLADAKKKRKLWKDEGGGV